MPELGAQQLASGDQVGVSEISLGAGVGGLDLNIEGDYLELQLRNYGDRIRYSAAVAGRGHSVSGTMYHSGMRLDASWRHLIVEEARRVFGPDVAVRLFGSRVDDNLRGGDIDLHIQAEGVSGCLRLRQ